jgi:hypothetical protein
MKKRHLAIAVLVILCSTTVFAAPRNDQSSPFARTFDRLVQVIKHIVHPLDDISASPPHP